MGQFRVEPLVRRNNFIILKILKMFLKHSYENIGDQFRQNKNVQKIENCLEVFNVGSYYLIWGAMVVSIMVCFIMYMFMLVYMIDIHFIMDLINETKINSSFTLACILICLILW